MTIDDLALQLTPRLGTKGVTHLLEVYGDARRIFAASRQELIEEAELAPAVADEVVRRSGFSAAERELHYCQKHGITPLASTDEEYPTRLREIPDYPHVIFLQGNPAALTGRTLAVVGTRKSTPYGEEQCARLVRELAERIPHLKIISGLAFGIDAAAHRAALNEGLKTVAVLANSLPEISPAHHRRLAEKILEEGGALLSELPSQTPMRSFHFLARNRLIAGLSSGTLLIESPASGGSLNTAAHADSYNRTVMALPGRSTDRESAGTNHLIRTHKAQLVCTASDIIEELQWDLGEDPTLFREKPPTEQLTKDEAGLLACFRSTDPLSIEELVELTGLDAGTLTALLVGLELAGRIRLVPGNRYMKPCD